MTTTNDKASNTMSNTMIKKVICHKDRTVTLIPLENNITIRNARTVSYDDLASLDVQAKIRVLKHLRVVDDEFLAHEDGTVTFYSIYTGWQRRVTATQISTRDYCAMNRDQVALIQEHCHDGDK